MKFEDYIKNVPDFPIEGIQFKDITPLIGDSQAFKAAIDGCPVAYALNAGFVPVRKPGKLPREVLTYDYSLEYGTNTLCMHKDAIKPGDRVVIMDDLLATGGTVEATVKLVEEAGGEVVGLGFMIELVDLKGRDKIKDYDVKVLMKF